MAQQAPRILHDDVIVNAAIGVLVASEHLDLETARAELEEAARRAGTTVTVVAAKLLAHAPHHYRDPDG